ncbi:MAG TPA: hypothetical protein VIA18_14555 [Polyangia bacterium]|nr:hypothetical protein [Polyangia bacterium]
MKRLLLLLFAVGVAGCASATPTSAHLAGANQCWSDGTQCTRSSDCCSMWCVNWYCERKEP